MMYQRRLQRCSSLELQRVKPHHTHANNNSVNIILYRSCMMMLPPATAANIIQKLIGIIIAPGMRFLERQAIDELANT